MLSFQNVLGAKWWRTRPSSPGFWPRFLAKMKRKQKNRLNTFVRGGDIDIPKHPIAGSEYHENSICFRRKKEKRL